MHHDFVLHVKNTFVLSSGCFWVVVQYQAEILGISIKTWKKIYNSRPRFWEYWGIRVLLYVRRMRGKCSYVVLFALLLTPVTAL